MHANLYHVTDSLCRLLSVNVWRLTGQEVVVSAVPPEVAEKETTSRLNLHLYHAVEDPNRRNEFPPDDSGPYPISRTPLPLTLYYALTAHSVTADSGVFDPRDAQRLLGLGMKSLHDFPLIDDALELPGPPGGAMTSILAAEMHGQQNRIEVVARPLSPEESVSFWSAAQNHTARATAYYEVRSLLMPPEPSAQQPPMAATFALGVTASGRPTLVSSTSIQTVKLPALSGGATLTTPVSPAVASLGAVAAPAGNHVVLAGESLGDGTGERIVLASDRFAGLAPPLDEAVIDPASNAAWKFLFAGDRVEFDAQPTVNAETEDGFAVVPIRPGIYSVAIRRNRALVTEHGATRISVAESNRIPFAIAAAIQSVAVVNPGGLIRITLRPGVVANDSANVPQLSIAGEVYALAPNFTGDPLQDEGRFVAATATRYEAHPLFDPNDGATRMVRLAINGVDCPPVWLEPGP